MVTPNVEELNTVSPKYSYANMVRELLKQDPELELSFDPDALVITINVCENEIKYLALYRLLNGTRTLVDGDVTIVVTFKHFGGDKYLKETVLEAFKNNPLFDYMYWWEDNRVSPNPKCWVSMNPEAIFYPESNLYNVWGDTVKLPEGLAQAVLNPVTDYIFYTSTNPDRERPDHSCWAFNDDDYCDECAEYLKEIKRQEEHSGEYFIG